VSSDCDEPADASTLAGEHLAVPLGVPRSLFPHVGGGEQGNGGYTRFPGNSRGTLGEQGNTCLFHDHFSSLARYGLIDLYGLVGVT
jgi:hypothetical protein